MTDYEVSDLIREDDGFHIVMEDLDGQEDDITLDAKMSFEILRDLTIEWRTSITQTIHDMVDDFSDSVGGSEGYDE